MFRDLPDRDAATGAHSYGKVKFKIEKQRDDKSGTSWLARLEIVITSPRDQCHAESSCRLR